MSNNTDSKKQKIINVNKKDFVSEIENDKKLKSNTIEDVKNCMNMFTNISSSIDKTNDFMQLQINHLNKKMSELLRRQDNDDKRYNKLISNINDVYDLVDTTQIHCNPVAKNICGVQNVTHYTDPDRKYKHIVDQDVTIFITMVGGGGAGGIGCIRDMYYYSGGGGGAGACFIQKPVFVKACSVIKIKVGAGGIAHSACHGGNTYVKIKYKCDTEKLVACGGRSGKPTLQSLENHRCDIITDGGSGGESAYCDCFCGKTGDHGNTTIPSISTNCGGNGGNSMMYLGGNGGSNYFCIGGKGGSIYENLVGKDGKFGSGGGGSAPKSKFCEEKLSGNGGNGIVIIEWKYNNLCEQKSDTC